MQRDQEKNLPGVQTQRRSSLALTFPNSREGTSQDFGQVGDERQLLYAAAATWNWTCRLPLRFPA